MNYRIDEIFTKSIVKWSELQNWCGLTNDIAMWSGIQDWHEFHKWYCEWITRL